MTQSVIDSLCGETRGTTTQNIALHAFFAFFLPSSARKQNHALTILIKSLCLLVRPKMVVLVCVPPVYFQKSQLKQQLSSAQLLFGWKTVGLCTVLVRRLDSILR